MVIFCRKDVITLELSTDQFDVMKLSLSYFNEVSNVEGLMDHELVEPKALALAALNKLKVGRIDFNAESSSDFVALG